MAADVYIPKALGLSSPNPMMSQRRRLTVKALRRPLTTGFLALGRVLKWISFGRFGSVVVRSSLT
jgi:hypothetical protein